MAVYVDSAAHRLGGMIMCHMTADSLTELLAMADRIGVARRHLQQPGRRPHFDVCRTKRAAAIAAGAEVVSSKEIARRARALAQAGA